MDNVRVDQMFDVIIVIVIIIVVYFHKSSHITDRVLSRIYVEV